MLAGTAFCCDSRLTWVVGAAGDVSFEELQFNDRQAAQQGKPPRQIAFDFDQGMLVRRQQLQQLCQVSKETDGQWAALWKIAY
jgi:hypothetical protein